MNPWVQVVTLETHTPQYNPPRENGLAEKVRGTDPYIVWSEISYDLKCP